MARPRRTDRLGEDHAAKPHTTSKRSDWQLKQLAVYTLTTGARLVGLAVTPPCIMSPPTCLAATYTQPRNGWTWPVDRRPLDLCRPEARIKRLHRAPRVIISNENSFFFTKKQPPVAILFWVPCANYIMMTYRNCHPLIRYPVWMLATPTLKWPFDAISPRHLLCNFNF